MRCGALQVARLLTRLARLPRHAVSRPQRNFGKPVEYGLVKQYPVRARARRGVRAARSGALTRIHFAAQWQQPVLMKLEVPVDVDGNPWPLDKDGKPIVEETASA